MKTNLLILLTLLLFSCKKEASPYQPVPLSKDLTNHVDSIQKYLPGKWKWVESRQVAREGGYLYYTPKTQGYNDYMAFSGDTIIFSRTGEAAMVRRFKVVREKEVTLWPEDEHPALVTYDIVTGAFASYYRLYISKDQLVLGMNYRGEIPDRIYERMR